MPKYAIFPLLIDRWVAGTRHLTREEKAAYLELCLHLFQEGGAIKNQAHACQILGGDPRTSRRLWAKVQHKFRRNSAGSYHELVAKIRRNNGRIMGLDYGVQGGVKGGTGSGSGSGPDLRVEKTLSQGSGSGGLVKTQNIGRASRFSDFWTAYPKKRKKKRAGEIWQSKRLDAKADQIIQDVETRLRADKRWLGGFIPDPTTYLNGHRWDDEIETAQPEKSQPLPHDYYNADGTVNERYRQ